MSKASHGPYWSFQSRPSICFSFDVDLDELYKALNDITDKTGQRSTAPYSMCNPNTIKIQNGKAVALRHFVITRDCDLTP